MATLSSVADDRAIAAGDTLLHPTRAWPFVGVAQLGETRSTGAPSSSLCYGLVEPRSSAKATPPTEIFVAYGERTERPDGTEVCLVCLNIKLGYKFRH